MDLRFGGAVISNNVRVQLLLLPMLVDLFLVATGATSVVVAAHDAACAGKKIGLLTPNERLPPFLAPFGTSPRRYLHSAVPGVVESLRGGAISPRYPLEASENSRRDGLGGDDDDTEAIDIEALLQSVTTDGEDVSIDIQELAELGDFSGLGRLDFNEATRESNHRRGKVGRQLEEEEEFDGMGWDENPPDCEMWNVVEELEEKGGLFGAGLSDEVSHDEEYWKDEEGEDVELEVEHGIEEAGMGRGVWDDGVEKQDAFEDDWEREESVEEMDGDPSYDEDADGDGSGVSGEKKSVTEQDSEDEEGRIMEGGEREEVNGEGRGGREQSEEEEEESDFDGDESETVEADEGGTIRDRWQGIERGGEDDEEQEIVDDGEDSSKEDYDEYTVEEEEDDEEEYRRGDNESVDREDDGEKDYVEEDYENTEGEREDDREECKKKDDEDMEGGKLGKEFDDARRGREFAISGESTGDWTTDDSLVEGTSVDDVSSYDEDDEDLGDQSTDYDEDETDVENETEQDVSFESSKGNTGSDVETSESEADDQSEERSYKHPSTNVEKSPETAVFEEVSQASTEGSIDDASEETRVGMEEWLDFQRQNPVPTDVPTRKTLDQFHEDGLTESDDEHEPEEIARKIREHRELGRRWVSGVTSSSGLRRTRKQVLKVMLLQATSNIIAGGGSPGTSPGRERLALAGVAIGCGTTIVHRRLRQRIEGADFGDAADVETKTRSPLAALLRKEACIRRVSVKEHDLACLRSTARWGIVLFVIGVVLSMACRAGEPLFICAALGLSRYFAEPIFFVHAMGRGGGPAGAQRPFTAPSILNSLLGSPHGLLSVDDVEDGHGGNAA